MQIYTRVSLPGIQRLVVELLGGKRPRIGVNAQFAAFDEDDLVAAVAPDVRGEGVEAKRAVGSGAVGGIRRAGGSA